ncbi:uncharacterized protein LOC106640250 [Copidosoma floridanum]|uniref:uncharacterized protein LOC106640250 n=1 Tax=Copidosoma floridanum TaxID=29053 RepID=UPI0006C96823|nr:uncharacterized protein LOC106640250 [Copidosoma floridanum]
MRTKRRELQELRQSKKTSGPEASGQEQRRQLFAEGQLGRVDSYYEIIKMIAGAGMGLAGGGIGMLRARRRDISIKPNRKLDRKSSRGMIYENEELRLRTIHINAEVEQGQNDIKKLRRENEQLRREIWSLRDEYDKLEEILKKQKSREESGEPEDRSENEATESSSDEEDEDDEDDEESDARDETRRSQHDEEERLENAENQKISSEKLTPLRTRLNFDDLPVVEEEEEIKKDGRAELDDRREARGNNPTDHQNDFLPYHGQTTKPNGFGYQADCPFVFASSPAGEASGYSNIVPVPLDESCRLTTARPQLYANTPSSNQEPQIPLEANFATPHSPLHLDVTGAYSHQPVYVSTATSPLLPPPPPPPVGWQNGVSTGPEGNFTRMQAPLVYDAQLVPSSSKDSQLFKQPEDKREKMTVVSAERRNAFFRQDTYDFRSGKSRDFNITAVGDSDGRENGLGDCDVNKRSIGDGGTGETDATTLVDGGPRHFFAPLPAKPRLVHTEEGFVKQMDNNGTARHSDSGCSPNSEKSVATVISRERYDCPKGSVDVCVNGAIPCHGIGRIESGDAKAFFSSENHLNVDDVRKTKSNRSLTHSLTRSASWQDLSTCTAFTESLKTSGTNRWLAKSDNVLNDMTTSSKSFKSQQSVDHRRSRISKSQSPEMPEISQLPSIDYKLFNNPFLQNFEQAYQNFPVRTDGPSPVTHPLSIQVCESPVSGASYSNPIKVQPSFSGPSIQEPDCTACKRKDFDRLRLMIPPARFPSPRGEQPEYHVTSFETPSPHTLQLPPMTPYELDALRKMPTCTSPVPQSPRLYQNVPFVPRGAAVFCPGQGVKMYYDTASMKVAAQTQTSIEDEIEESTNVNCASGDNPTLNQPKKRRSRKDKSGSVKDKQRSSGSVKRKDRLKKQTSTCSRDVPESPGKPSPNARLGETQDDVKNESRSSSSGQESPKKEHQTKRVSLYFSAKKRPSVSSTRTSRSRSVDNTRERQCLTRGEASPEAMNGDSDRERTNSISSREAAVKEKTRKGSTSSGGGVPWCACWGNGCV